MIIHHHLIYQAEVKRNDFTKLDFKNMFFKLLKITKMKLLISPHFALSHQNAWSGLIGIVTSHMSFHYWVDESYVQFDIYSCKSFDINAVLIFLDDFWKVKNRKKLFITRNLNEEFKIRK